MLALADSNHSHIIVSLIWGLAPLGIFGIVQPQSLNHRGHPRQYLAPARLATLLTLVCLLLGAASTAIASTPCLAWSVSSAPLQSIAAPADEGTPPFASPRTDVGKVRRPAGWSPQPGTIAESPRTGIAAFVLALNAGSLALAARDHTAPAQVPLATTAASVPAHQYPPGQAPPRPKASRRGSASAGTLTGLAQAPCLR